jgi:hypothetical protein
LTSAGRRDDFLAWCLCKHADELVGTDMVLGTWKHPELASQPGWWGESALEE